MFINIYKYCFLYWIFENGKKYESTKYESTEMGRHTVPSIQHNPSG